MIAATTAFVITALPELFGVHLTKSVCIVQAKSVLRREPGILAGSEKSVTRGSQAKKDLT
jgi:hypothetical protein